MRHLYKTSAYLTAFIHFIYGPFAVFLMISSKGQGVVESIYFGVSASATTIALFYSKCPLTVLEKWFRKKYDPQWVFNEIWTKYYLKKSRYYILKLIKR